MESMFWNQVILKQPVTSAHQIKLMTKECRSMFEQHITQLRMREADFSITFNTLQSETVILKQFLYKVSAVFRQDKSIKTLKQILKCVKKFSDMELSNIFSHIIEQHSLGNIIHVSPKPTLEFCLVRFQGAARLLAQILCYCQHCMHATTPRMRQGHFINISMISISLVSRIWATSLHLLKLLIKQYSETKKVYDSGYLPESSARFLPENCTLLPSLEDWLLADPTLIDIQITIISITQEKNPDPETLKLTASDDVHNREDEDEENDELCDLMELRDLVTKPIPTSDLHQNLKRKQEADQIPISVPEKRVDLGELVRRTETIPLKNKKQRRRNKNRK